MKFRSYLILFIGISLSFSSCISDIKTHQQLLTLAHTEHTFKCHLDSIKNNVSILWDDVNIQLDSTFRNKVPQDELRNMKKVRNAKLIKMFQSYDSLKANVKAMINEADSIDQNLAKQVLVIKSKLQENKNSQLEYLKKINSKTKREKLVNMIKSVVNEPC